MTSTWHSLIWKEWHEHKWKLVSILAVFLGTSALPLIAFDRDMFAGAAALLFICSAPMAIFIGLGVASNERSRGTLAFAQALPIPLWRLALVKLLLGFATLFVPILLTVALFYVCRWAFTLAGVDVGAAVEQANRGPITGNWFLDCLLVGATVAASFFIWSAATGVNRKDEVSAGAVTLAVMVGWCTVLFAIGHLIFAWDHPSRTDDAVFRLIAGFGLSTAPAGFVPALAMAEANFLPIWLVIVTATAIHLALANWYVRRFGRIEDIGVRSPRTAMSIADGIGWLGAPRRSAITAIAWKQFRESGPLALIGVAGSVAITAISIIVDASYGPRQWSVAELFADVYPKMAVMFGAFVALVAGIGVCSNDMGPQINTFWRSRPIHADLWFWSKFATGLAVVLASIYVPIAILGALGFPVFTSWNFPDAIAIPVGHIALFAAAVAMTVLVRHAVYAAILSIAVVYLGVLVGLAGWMIAGWIGWVRLNADWWEPTPSQLIFGMILSFTISTIIAWLAMRYDWGRKSRY